MKLTAEARRARILELLSDGRHATVRELADSLGTATDIVRRDVYVLEERGVLLVGQDDAMVLHVSLAALDPRGADFCAICAVEGALVARNNELRRELYPLDPVKDRRSYDVLFRQLVDVDTDLRTLQGGRRERPRT